MVRNYEKIDFIFKKEKTRNQIIMKSNIEYHNLKIQEQIQEVEPYCCVSSPYGSTNEMVCQVFRDIFEVEISGFHG